MTFETEQEEFWAGEFGNDYINRNQEDDYLKSNLILFQKALQKASSLSSVIEFGPNIGVNLRAIHNLFPEVELNAIEINARAVEELKKWGKISGLFHKSILDFKPEKHYDLVLVKGVLIHQDPSVLPQIYDLLYESSAKYILMAEYFNPTPVEVPYRGYTKKLFKRDFAGELLERHKDLKLIDYGFAYSKDQNYPPNISRNFDDETWFLMKKGNV